MNSFSKRINSGEISAFDAKTHLSKLLEFTSQGREFIITKRGKPVARLIPAEGLESNELNEGLNLAREFRMKINKPVAIISLRDKGRKY